MATKSSKSTGLRKSHGPKTKRFHGYSKAMRITMARSGMLNKYHDVEAYKQSCLSKGIPYSKFLGMFVGSK